jgi:hypothetical protein
VQAAADELVREFGGHFDDPRVEPA